MRNEVILSICIGTYNREAYVKKLVEELLCIDRNDIEIVVNDNKSTDNTVESLNKITDTRLKVYTNDLNIGGPKNYLMSIYKANGKYALYCNDRDFIDINKIEKLINLLYKKDYSCVYVKRQFRKTTGKLEIYKKGYDALCNMEVKLHPTGFVFNREIIEKYVDMKKLINIETLYPFEHLMMEVIPYADAAMFDLGIYIQPEMKFFYKNKSGYTPATKDINIEDMWFHPYYDIKLFKEFMNHILELNNGYSDEEKSGVTISYARILSMRIWEYKRKIWSRSFASHYSTSRRFVPTYKMLGYVKTFFGEVKSFAVQNNIFVNENEMKKISAETYKKTFWESLKCDINIILGRIK